MSFLRSKQVSLALSALTLAIATPATQAAYPEKNIQYIIPFAAGGESTANLFSSRPRTG